ADVDALVKKKSALDDHAKQNTTSVYTAAEIFPMLPEKLSTNLTSLNYESDRLAVIVEMVIASDGSLLSSDVYRAMVRTHAKLAYTAWLIGWRGMDLCRNPCPRFTVSTQTCGFRAEWHKPSMRCVIYTEPSILKRLRRAPSLTETKSKSCERRNETGLKQLLRTS